MTTPPSLVGLPSGSGWPEETLAAIWSARRLLPQPWSPSKRVKGDEREAFVPEPANGLGTGEVGLGEGIVVG